MSQTKPKEPNGGPLGRLSLDVKSIQGLIDLMVDNDLSRIELREGESHIVLRRGHPNPMVPTAMVPATSASPVPSTSPAAPSTAPPGPVENEILIRSPMVGTFYTAPDRETQPFVEVGSVIEANTVVCLIEAMKVLNELKAEVAGRITKVLVKNASAVEFDQPLFAVSPA